MHCVVDIDGEPEAVVSQTRTLLELVVAQNQAIMRRQSIPPLYESGVRFRNEPWGDKVQHFARCTEVLIRKFGDCKQLCAWRVAELRNAFPGRSFGFQIYTRWHNADALHGAMRTSNGRKLAVHHVQVLHANGGIEDPSRLLHR